MKRPFFDTKCHRSSSGQHAISPLFFRDKIVHRTPVYDARTFLNFGRNFMKPGEKPFPFSKIAHAAPQKKQLPQNEPYPSAIAAFSVSKNSFRSRRHFAFHRRPSRFPCALPPKTGGLPRNMLASSATGGASPVSPSWVISALRAALRRLRSETRLRAQSRTHPLPARGMRRTARTVGTPLFISSFCPLGGGTGLFTKADFCYNRAKVSLCP